MKSSKVSIKTRSTPASLSFKGQATKHTIVKLSIGTTDLDELKKLLLTSPAKQMIIDDSTKTISQFLLYLNYKRKTTLHLKNILNIIKLELSKFK